MLMANAKKIVGIILLVIGLFIIILFISGGILMLRAGRSWGWFVGYTIMGVVLFVIGLVFLMASRKKNSKSPDK